MGATMGTIAAADLSPLEGWTAIERGDGRTNRSFVSGEPDGDRLRCAYFRAADGTMTGRVWFGRGAEGPPGHAHGGSQAAVLDEVMGGNCWLQGHKVLAAQITIDFRKPLPLGTSAVIHTGVERVEGRKVWAFARICDLDGEVFSEGRGLFIVMKDALLKVIFEAAEEDGLATPDAY